MDKTIVSTALSDETLEQLDAFCGRVHRNRAEVIRGLLYALLVEGKQFIFDEWRKDRTGNDHRGMEAAMLDARCEQHIRKVLTRGPIPVVDLKRKTNYARYGIDAWSRALKGLVSSGQVRTVEKPDGKVWVMSLKTLG